MGRKQNKVRAHARPRQRGGSRVLQVLLGLLVVVLGGLAGAAFLAPELLVEAVPEPLDVRTVGMAAGGLAGLFALALMVSVVRGRRRRAETEFSRPQLATVAALTPEEEAAARHEDEASPLLPEPPSMAPPAEEPSPVPVAAPVPSGSNGAAAVEPNGSAPLPAETPPPRPSGSGVHVFEANQPNGNGHQPAPKADPQPASRNGGVFSWAPRHTEGGELLIAEAWSFGPAGSSRRRRR
jgi:hypothetical protein